MRAAKSRALVRAAQLRGVASPGLFRHLAGLPHNASGSGGQFGHGKAQLAMMTADYCTESRRVSALLIFGSSGRQRRLSGVLIHGLPR